MRILMVTRGVVSIQPGAGGAELVALQLAQELVRTGHEVTLVSDVFESVELPRRLRVRTLDSRVLRVVHRLPGGFFRWLAEHFVGNLTAARAARRLLADGGFDCVHAHGALSALLIARRSRVPVVYTEHDATPWLCRYRRWWERGIRKVVYRLVNVTAWRRVDHAVAVFDSLRSSMVVRHDVPEERVTTVVNGTDVDVFNPHRAGLSIVRDEVGFERYALFVGRLTPRKAPDILLRALVDTPDICCAFAGDGPMRSKLEELATSLGLADRVAFLGNVAPTDLGRVYADADFTVLPSVSEGMPLAVIESMACGTPVLTTRLAGTETLIDDWETGFLVKPDDLGQLEMALRFLWGDADLRARMGRNARAKAIRDFVWPQVASQYLDLYSRLRLAAPVVEPVEAIPSLQA
jgi:teichuronic acid biosynthesis glycosyltransferase TuaC